MRKIKPSHIVMYLFLGLLLVICFFPFYAMIINATRTTGQILSGFSLVPGNAIGQNIKELAAKVNISSAFVNSLFIALGATLLSGYFSALTAYAFVVYNMKFKNVLFGIVLVIMMIPPQLSIIGLYKFMKEINLLDNYLPLIVPSIATASSVFFIRQYAKTALPSSLIEAARIDGAGEFRIFNKIGLPLMSPAIFTMAITSFIASWNNYLTPLILLSDQKKFTLPLIIRVLSSDVQDPSAGAMYLAIAISIIPILIVFFIFSRYIIDGVAAGGVKE